MAMDRRDGASGDGKGDRAARLAEALRENLHRRKTQARTRRQAGQGGEAVAPEPPENGPDTGTGPGNDDRT